MKRDDLPEDLGLTEEERAALEEIDDEEGEDDGQTGAAAAGDDDDDGEQDDESSKDEGKAGDKAGAADATAAAPTDAGEGAAGADPQPARQAVPDWKAPEDGEARLAEIAQQREDLAEQFDNGEITAREFQAAQRKLEDAQRQIERANDRAEMAAEMVQAVWVKTTVPGFLEAHAVYRDNETLMSMLDSEVRRQQVAAIEAGNDPFDPAILAKADTAIMTALRKVNPGAAPEPQPGTGTPTATAARPIIPPTLGGLPVAEISGTGDGRYASLDRLADTNPIAFEDALARLPESERAAYLNQ